MNTDLAAQKVMDRRAKHGVGALSDAEKTLLAAWQFEAGVSNAGFLGYFSGARGDLAFHAPTALVTIGAPRLAALATEANAVFGVEGPPSERDERQARVQALPDSARRALVELDQRYFDCDEDIDELLDVFVEANLKAHD